MLFCVVLCVCVVFLCLWVKIDVCGCDEVFVEVFDVVVCVDEC